MWMILVAKMRELVGMFCGQTCEGAFLLSCKTLLLRRKLLWRATTDLKFQVYLLQKPCKNDLLPHSVVEWVSILTIINYIKHGTRV
jgi:hypothetical protein